MYNYIGKGVVDFRFLMCDTSKEPLPLKTKLKNIAHQNVMSLIFLLFRDLKIESRRPLFLYT